MDSDDEVEQLKGEIQNLDIRIRDDSQLSRDQLIQLVLDKASKENHIKTIKDQQATNKHLQKALQDLQKADAGRKTAEAALQKALQKAAVAEGALQEERKKAVVADAKSKAKEKVSEFFLHGSGREDIRSLLELEELVAVSGLLSADVLPLTVKYYTPHRITSATASQKSDASQSKKSATDKSSEPGTLTVDTASEKSSASAAIAAGGGTKTSKKADTFSSAKLSEFMEFRSIIMKGLTFDGDALYDFLEKEFQHPDFDFKVFLESHVQSFGMIRQVFAVLAGFKGENGSDGKRIRDPLPDKARIKEVAGFHKVMNWYLNLLYADVVGENISIAHGHQVPLAATLTDSVSNQAVTLNGVTDLLLLRSCSYYDADDNRPTDGSASASAAPELAAASDASGQESERAESITLSRVKALIEFKRPFDKSMRSAAEGPKGQTTLYIEAVAQGQKCKRIDSSFNVGVLTDGFVMYTIFRKEIPHPLPSDDGKDDALSPKVVSEFLMEGPKFEPLDILLRLLFVAVCTRDGFDKMAVIGDVIDATRSGRTPTASENDEGDDGSKATDNDKPSSDNNNDDDGDHGGDKKVADKGDSARGKGPGGRDFKSRPAFRPPSFGSIHTDSDSDDVTRVYSSEPLTLQEKMQIVGFFSP